MLVDFSPCKSELTCHINPSAFTAKMWANADKKEIDQHPKSMTAENFRMIRTSRGSTVISFLVHWFQRKMTQFPMSGKMMMTLFYLQTTIEAGDLGSDEDTPADSQ